MLHKNLILISRKILKQIISEFILEHSTNTILDRVNISKYKLLKILTLIRIEMAKASCFWNIMPKRASPV